jgi:hypothetical protein
VAVLVREGLRSKIAATDDGRGGDGKEEEEGRRAKEEKR